MLTDIISMLVLFILSVVDILLGDVVYDIIAGIQAVIQIFIW